MHSQDTLAYFCAPKGHLWEWHQDEGGGDSCLIWGGIESDLIVYRSELIGLLEACAPAGLPPLGSLLFVIAATSDAYEAFKVQSHLWAACQRATGIPSLPHTLPPLWKTVGSGLARIHAMSADLRASGPARWRLVSTLFEVALPDRFLDRTLHPSRAKDIIAAFEQTPFIDDFQSRSPALNGIARMLKDLTVLEKVFQRCPPESLEERLRTGVDEPSMRQLELPLPDPDARPVTEPPTDLLRALEKAGGELAQIAGLVRRMSAILHVPKAVTHRDDLPLGGVSDITNRGDPSRLLMTELAWDDLTFAVRLAQGEALYLRRELPPAEPPPSRVLLIDNGIFLWGKPRLFALGAALALLQQKVSEQTPVGRVFSLVEGHFIPVALATVDDVRAQLTRLEPQPHPSAALHLLADAANTPLQLGEEVFLLTHPAAAEMLTALPIWQQLAHRLPLHTLLVDREGSLELSRHSSAGARLLAKAHVKAEDLFETRQTAHKKNSPTSPTTLTNEAGRLPQFFRQLTWPLDHPAPPSLGFVYEVPNRGFIGKSTEGCICWWDRTAMLGKVILYTMPAEEFLVAADRNDPDWHFLIFRDRDSRHIEIALVSIKTFECNGVYRIQTGHSKSLLPCLNSGYLVIHLDDRSEAWSILDPEVAKVATIQRTSKSKGWPVFDGGQFHEQGIAETPCLLYQVAGSIPTQHSTRQIIGRLHSAGIGTNGRLMIATEGGHVYRLSVSANKGPAWIGIHERARYLQPLQTVDLDRWKLARLKIALLGDGRRIIYDPLGYLHVCDGDDGEQLSLILVKGHTAAWTPDRKFYGEPNLMRAPSRPSSHAELLTLTQKLFRPVIAYSSIRKKGPMP